MKAGLQDVEKVSYMNTQEKNDTQTKPNTAIIDSTPILSRRKKRRISAGW